MAVPAYPADPGTRGLGFESCAITRWRGYVTSSFVAVHEDGTPLAESAAFRARGRATPPDKGAARSAFDELRAELERQGWDAAADRPDTWYEARFTRPAAVLEPVVQAAPPPLAPPQFALPALAPTQPAPQQVEPPVAAGPQAHAEPTELPPAAGKAAGASRPSRPIVVVGALGIVAALALGGYIEFGPSAHHAVRRTTTAVAAAKPKPKPKLAAPKPASTPTPKQAARTPVSAPKAATVRLDISANTRASWLEIRRGSATGRVLFSGELAPGRHLHLAGKRLWARFGAARNVTIRANGRPISFTGTYEHLFAAAKK